MLIVRTISPLLLFRDRDIPAWQQSFSAGNGNDSEVNRYMCWSRVTT
jgi:hypothetical protein